MLFIHSEIEHSSILELDGRWSSIEVKHTCKITLGFILHHSLHRFLSFVDIHTYVPIEKVIIRRDHTSDNALLCAGSMYAYFTPDDSDERNKCKFMLLLLSFPPVAFVFMFGTKTSDHRTMWWDSIWNLLAKWMQIRAEREREEKNISRLSLPDVVQRKCQRTTYPGLNKRY